MTKLDEWKEIAPGLKAAWDVGDGVYRFKWLGPREEIVVTSECLAALKVKPDWFESSRYREHGGKHLICAKCELPVEIFETWRDIQNREYVVVLECHGKKEQHNLGYNSIVDVGGKKFSGDVRLDAPLAALIGRAYAGKVADGYAPTKRDERCRCVVTVGKAIDVPSKSEVFQTHSPGQRVRDISNCPLHGGATP